MRQMKIWVNKQPSALKLLSLLKLLFIYVGDLGRETDVSMDLQFEVPNMLHLKYNTLELEYSMMAFA